MRIHGRTTRTTAPDTLAPIISGSGGLGGHSADEEQSYTKVLY